jgi:iron(III) transport system ATP-binding protein
MTAIRIDNLFHTYRDKKKTVTAVDHVSLDIKDSEFYTLLGPSGCGKTTTLRCIAGLEQPTSGTIELGGVVVVSDRVWVPTHRRDIGMVFQDYAVWPHMSVFENVAFPLKISKQFSSSEIRDRVVEALHLMNMEEYVDRRATQLSGGQQQRLSLARALVRQPKVLLLDEPLSNLDAKLREQMRTELRQIQRRVNITTVFVTHDQVEALSLSNRIAVMSNGKVVQEGPPRDIYLAPNSRFVADFVGATSLISGVVEPGDDEAETVVSTSMGRLRCRADGQVGTGDDVIVAMRPESIAVTAEPVPNANCFAAEVKLGLFVGDAVDYQLHVGDEIVRAKGEVGTQFNTGDKVFVSMSPHSCVLLDSELDSAALTGDEMAAQSPSAGRPGLPGPLVEM